MRAGPVGEALARVLTGLRHDRFFLVLLAGLLVLPWFATMPLHDMASLVDGATLGALAGLLLLTKGLELSGALRLLGQRLVATMPSERGVALSLVLAAAGLSTVLTNDVALFVVVPLTLGVCRIAPLPATRLIVFEALAVNAGSTLTPIGNPQNLFLWQLAKVPFGEFVRHQLPLVALLMGALVVLTIVAFRGRAVHVAAEAPPALDGRLLGLSLALYVPFLAAAEHGHALAGAGGLLLLYVVLRPRAVLELDWGLLLVFALMFIDLRLLARWPVVQSAMAGWDLGNSLYLYLASIAASQVVSNVPAAIALAEYSDNWRVMAYGVNVGGFGLMVGSLANLIALRMSADPRAWRTFHAVSLPALGVAAAAGACLLGLA